MGIRPPPPRLWRPPRRELAGTESALIVVEIPGGLPLGKLGVADSPIRFPDQLAAHVPGRCHTQLNGACWPAGASTRTLS